MMPTTPFATWFQRHAGARPTVPAIVTPRVRLTYSELYRAVLAAALRLTECGIARGQTVAICAQNQALLCVLLAAFNRLGVVTITLNLPARPDGYIGVPEGVRIDRFVVEQPFTGVIPDGSLIVDLDWLKPADVEARDLPAPVFNDGDEISTIFAISGPSGGIRGIELSSRRLEARLLKHSLGLLGEGRSETTFSHFSVGTVPGFRIAFETFWAGGTLFLGWPTHSIPAVVSHNRIVRMYASPADYQAILQAASPVAPDLSSLRCAMVDGSGMPRTLIGEVRTKLCATLINLYSPRELGLVAFGRLSEQNQLGRCGVLVPWMQAQTVSGEGEALPAGDEGTLRFRCEEMVTGYLNDSRGSAECFRDGWFYPGDNGRISENRTLTITPRS